MNFAPLQEFPIGRVARLSGRHSLSDAREAAALTVPFAAIVLAMVPAVLDQSVKGD